MKRYFLIFATAILCLCSIVETMAQTINMSAPSNGAVFTYGNNVTVSGTTTNAPGGTWIHLRNTTTDTRIDLGSGVNYGHNISWGSSFSFSIPYNKLVAGHNYRVTIEAVNGGNQVWSERTFSIAAINLTTNDVSTSSITSTTAYLSGSGAVGTTAYGIEYRPKNSSGSWTTRNNGSETITGLTPCRDYEFRYWGGYPWGTVYGPIKYFTTLADAPTGVSASKNGSSVSISWSSAYGTLTNYEIWRSSSASGTYSVIGSVYYTTTSYTDNSPMCGYNYYKVKACGTSCGCSGLSSSYDYVNYTSPTAPTSITGDGTTICSGNSTTLYASGGSEGSGCTYQWYSGGCGSGSVLGTGSSITVNPTSNTTYYVRRVGTSPCNSTTTGCASGTVYVSTPPTAPTGITGTTTICSGNSTTLYASGGSDGSGCTYQWYSGGCGSGSVLGTGSSITVSPTSNTTYYVRRVGASPCNSTTTSCASVMVYVSTPPTAPTSITGTTTICSGSSTTLTASGGSDGSGCTYQWYSGGCGSGSVLGTGSSITVSPTSTTTYCVRRVGTSPCGSTTTSCACVTVTVNTAPTAPTGITGTTTICSGNSTTLYASGGSEGSGCTYQWYSGGCGSGSVLGTGSSITVSPTSTTTYYVRRVGTSPCNGITTSCASVTVTVNTIPSITNTTPNSRCGTGTVTLSATASSGATIRWYSSSTGGTVLYTGTSYTTPSISTTTTYYAEAYNSSTGCISTSRTAVTATVNDLPTITNTTPNSRCGAGTVTLCVTVSSGATVRWYSSSTGGTVLYTGTCYTTPSTGATTTYYVEAYNSSTGCVSSRTAVVATVNDLPTITNTTSNSRCGTGTVTLSATASSGATVRWYSSSTGGTALYTGTSFTTPSISTTTTYYAEAYNSSTGCISTSRTAVIATINVIPTITSTTPASRTGTGTVTLSASASSGATVRWYSSSTGGTSLYTGTSFTTPSISVTTTYYAEAYNSGTGCVSASRTDVKATVIICGVEPLLKTKWDQSTPYNDACPMYNGQRSVTGCVATAMAQIMNYWQHPISRTVTIPSYKTDKLGISVPAIIGTTTYDWNNMKNITAEYTTTTQRNAVAKLMYECGVAVKMDYTPSSSGAYNSNALSALPTYFGYNNAINIKRRQNYSNVDWESLLRSELEAGRPIYYTGRDPQGGHAFVCDGFKCDGTFHFNWGWGGYYDGYFVTSALNVGYAFNSNQEAIVNIKPNDSNFFYPIEADGTNSFVIYAEEGNGGSLIPSEFTFVHRGANQPYTFKAYSGYEIDKVLINNQINETAKANEYYIFTNVTQNHTIKVTFKKSSSGIENIHSQDISIYPNPAKDEIFIKTDSQVEKIEIYSLTGTLLIQENNFNEKISVSVLSKGIYLLKVYTDKGVAVSKIVKE